MPSAVSRAGAAALALLVTLAPPLAPGAAAVTLDWNGSTGNAGNAANWTPAQVPTAGDALRFATANACTVTFGAQVPASFSFEVSDGSPAFRFTSPHTHTDAIRVGTAALVPAWLAILRGELTNERGAIVGKGTANEGTLRIEGGSTDVVWSNPVSTVEVGTQSGRGRFELWNGGRARLATAFKLGEGFASSGELYLNGRDPVTGRGAALVLDPHPTAPLRVGVDAEASVTVGPASLLDCRRDLRIGERAGASGSLFAFGSYLDSTTRVWVDGDLWIGRNDDATPAGQGSVLITGHTEMTVTGATYTYDEHGSDGGTLTIDDGTVFTTGSLHVADPAAELVMYEGAPCAWTAACWISRGSRSSSPGTTSRRWSS